MSNVKAQMTNQAKRQRAKGKNDKWQDSNDK
jgi:hypothetical protein